MDEIFSVKGLEKEKQIGAAEAKPKEQAKDNLLSDHYSNKNMGTFQKFISLYNIDSRFKTEIGEGFLWYHCRATGEKAVDSRLLLEYYRAAETEPPTIEELAKSFVESRNAVTKGISHICFGLNRTLNAD